MPGGWIYDELPHADRRREVRRRLGIPSVVYVPKTRLRFSCTVVDLSQRGARVHCDEAHSLPDSFVLFINGAEAISRVCDVVRRTGATLGVRFRYR
jgi:hypothetical protein